MTSPGDTREAEMRRLLAYHRMMQSNDMQRALTIATHYLAVTNAAADIHKMLKLRTTAAMLGADTDSTDAVTLQMVELIRDQHAKDLGIDLDWPEIGPKPYHWDVYEDYPVEDWQYEVANDDTRLGYHEWVLNQREQEEDDEQSDRT